MLRDDQWELDVWIFIFWDFIYLFWNQAAPLLNYESVGIFAFSLLGIWASRGCDEIGIGLWP